MSARTMILASLFGIALLLPAASTTRTHAASDDAALTVVSASPNGELRGLEDANEIRVVFSEPMVALGRPPAAAAPFFSITPAAAGTLRWSGTTTLVFTPASALPYATRFTVRIAAGATSAAGNSLASPFTFTFTTPTVQLLATEWYREGGRVDAPVVVALRFNQPVDAAAAAPHLSVRYEPHEWTPPDMPEAARARLRTTAPDALAAYNRKIAATTANARRSAIVPFTTATSWDTERFPKSDRLVVIRTSVAPPPESWLAVTAARALPGRGGSARPDEGSTQTIELEPAFFVTGFKCHSQCDPSDWNPIVMGSPVRVSAAAAAMTVTNITTSTQPVARARSTSDDDDAAAQVTLEDAGFPAQPPATTYAVTLDPSLRSADGQTLGYRWLGVVENWHAPAFTSFGDGHGVWEQSGGTVLPFYAQNVRSIKQWVERLDPASLMSRVLAMARDRGKETAPAGAGIPRTLQPTPDTVQSHGLDLSKALGASGTGLVLAAIQEGEPLARSKPITPGATRTTIVQVTNLGVTVKDAPSGTLVFVTRLDTAAPVAGATVSLVDATQQVVWRGTTDATGVAMAPAGPRDRERTWELSFIAVVEKDGDVAYAASDWNEGIQPWEFGLGYDPRPAAGDMRGTVFTDRGVYRPGERIHLKAILRRVSAAGVALLPAGTTVTATIRDSRNREIENRQLTLNRWSSAEWTATVPEAGTLGNYFVEVREANEARGVSASDETAEAAPLAVYGEFLVAAYRRPDFGVDTSLDREALAGASLGATARGRYLFGAAMGSRPVRWSFSRTPVFNAPAAVYERFPDRSWTFVGWREDARRETETMRASEEPLTGAGTIARSIETDRAAGLPYRYTFEAEIEDVTRQRLAGRSTALVHPAPWYVGIRTTNTLVRGGAPLTTAIVAVTPAGQTVAGVPVAITLNRVQWHSVRRADGGGFYTWESERRVTPVETIRVVSADTPAPVTIDVPEGGAFEITAVAEDTDGRRASSTWSFYAEGEGYTAWARYDHHRIDLVAERATWKPGESARLMIQSPWETATALVTVERERVRSHRTFALTSTQQAIDIPITEADIPNIYVSVLLVKGRTSADPGRDGSDPGKPAFRLGYAELQVDDARKRLEVEVTANREEYRPASNAQVAVRVRDANGRGAASEVTLWAVDEGVLQLTGFAAPDVLRAVYQQEPLQVMTVDSRERIVSRRVLTPKGSTDGGGGGLAGGPGDLRRDFRVLAFWLGSIETGADGRASTTVTLPESMTSYRLMAVAADAASRFGSGRAAIRVNRPVTMRPLLPRFLTPGDRASIGAAVTNTLSRGGTATVTIESADPTRLRIDGATTARVAVGAGATVDVPFSATALAPGAARVRLRVQLNGETDALELPVPIGVIAPWEVTAAHGQTTSRAAQPIALPSGVLPGGGLHVELAGTALSGIGEGARYLVEYPYGCVEQRASSTLALMLAADLNEAFALPGFAPADLRARAQRGIDELLSFQCPDGGFGFWPGQCGVTSPYVTSYVLDVLQRAVALGYRTADAQLDESYLALERALATVDDFGNPAPASALTPADAAWQAFAARVLARAGRPQDAVVTRLFEAVNRMPVFGLSYLADAVQSATPRDTRLPGLERLIANSLRVESATAHVEELADPELAWLWSSNTRSTAIVLEGLVTRGVTGDLAARLARYLIGVRSNGRWDDTQENAWALAALSAYYRAFESTAPAFTASASLDGRTLAAGTFQGRSAPATSADVPLADLAAAAGEAARDLIFAKTGDGTLFYGARLRYQVDPSTASAREAGIKVERRYEPYDESGTATKAAGTSFAAGDLVRVVLTITAPAERQFVAATDPLPAGFEVVDGWFRTTARDLAREASVEGDGDRGGSWLERMRRGGFDHIEKFDDRVQLFATRLGTGRHEFSYLVRATTSGVFLAAPAWAEQMYEPEVHGRSAPARIEVRK